MEQKQHVQIVVADPTALGLFGLAIVTFVAASQKLAWTTGVSFIIPWAVFLGSAAQLMACVYDFKHNNIFGATVFGAYGLFWIGVASCLLIKIGAFGPQLAASVDIQQLGFAYFGYFIFSIFATIAATAAHKVLLSIMILIDVLLLCLSLDAWGVGGHLPHAVAAWSELTIALLSFYGSGATFLNKFFNRPLLPLGKGLQLFK